jgi:hypothetical protein
MLDQMFRPPVVGTEGVFMNGDDVFLFFNLKYS